MQEPIQCPWVIIFGQNAVYAECSVGLDWVYLTRELDLLSLCNTHQTSTVEPSETASNWALLCHYNASRFYALVFMPYQASSGSHCAAEHTVFLESLLALLKRGALRDQLRLGAVYE